MRAWRTVAVRARGEGPLVPYGGAELLTIARSVTKVRELLDGKEGIGLVPTMGAFHEGHLALMRQCRKECETTVVSLFVNPLQFGPGEDLERYPRPFDRDVDLAEAEGVDVLFAPDESFTAGMTTTVSVGPLAQVWEGAARPGHFDGVATIVLKLFLATKAQKAFFGLKDLQQCAVIRKMVSDLEVPVVLRFMETVREESGLALSSRNAYLSDGSRLVASGLHKALEQAAYRLRADLTNPSAVLEETSERLRVDRFDVEYLAVVDPETMQEAVSPKPTDRLIAAVRLEQVRLIDNVPVG